MKSAWLAFICGVVFAAGLGISGMTQPGKVTAFLDFAGAWDPSLLFVMAGAVGVYAVGYRLVVRRPKPLFADAFQLPKARDLDRPLLLGAALFGVGWGLAGFCPGPALTSLVSLRAEPWTFGVSMLAGMAIFEAVDRLGRKA
jgi:uncharacterized membrane protein YedE/YeeE